MSCMNKRLLVLAAGRYQLDTIRCAKRLGNMVITLDKCPGNPGHREADKSYNVDTTDMNSVLEVARRERIDGVIAACTDVAVPTAAFVAEEMHLAGLPLQSARIACNKTLFRSFLSEHGFLVPKSVQIGPGFEPHPGVFDSGPWIMKPDDSSGSKGIFIVRSRSELLEHLPQTLSFSRTGSGILEQFICGLQGTCEGVLRRGEVELVFVTDRLTADPPFVATRGHIVPTTIPARAEEMLAASLSRTWRLLGVSDGPFDCDFVAGEDGVYLLEVSPRIGGNCIASLMRESLGFDIVEHSVRVALGENPELPPGIQPRPAAAVILGVKKSGRLKYDRKEVEALSGESWVRALSLDVGCGDAVEPFTNGRQRVGEAILVCRDRAEVETRIAELYNRLNLRAVP